ncbi:MAG TPA: hypothetical protein VIL46_03585, partial [Gemmataceae bacterium]
MDCRHLAKSLLTKTVRLARRLRRGTGDANPRRPRRPLRLALEALEERVVPAADAALVAVGAGPGAAPWVKVLEAGSGAERLAILAYDASFTGGVRVALADLTGDGTPDLVTAPGPGGGPHVKLFDGATGNLLESFYAYDKKFTGGVCVAAGETGFGPGIVTGADLGGGPHVRVFTPQGKLQNEFFAYEQSFTGGVRVALGREGDGSATVVTAPGAGGGPHVKVFDARSGKELRGFFAYDPSFTGGVSVAAYDLDADGASEVVTGAGPGGGPHVRSFRGADGSPMHNFFAAHWNQTGGTHVAVLPATAAGPPQLAVGMNFGDGARVRRFAALTGWGGARPEPAGEAGPLAWAGGAELSLAASAPHAGGGGVGALSGPMVAVYDVNPEQTAEGSTNPAVFYIYRDWASQDVTVHYAMSGTATNGDDYAELSGELFISGNPYYPVYVPVHLTATDDALVEGTESATLTIQPGAGYTVHSTSDSGTATITDDEYDDVLSTVDTFVTVGEVILAPCNPLDGSYGGIYGIIQGIYGSFARETSEYPVRYADGVVRMGVTDLAAQGFGLPWGHSRSWTNWRGYDRGHH